MAAAKWEPQEESHSSCLDKLQKVSQRIWSQHLAAEEFQAEESKAALLAAVSVCGRQTCVRVRHI